MDISEDFDIREGAMLGICVFHGCTQTTFLRLLHLACTTILMLVMGRNHLASSLGLEETAWGQAMSKDSEEERV